MTELSQLLRQLCSRGILERRRDVDSPTDFYFATLQCGAGIAYAIARLVVEHPDWVLLDTIVRAVSSELREFMTEHKIVLVQTQFEAWVTIISNVGWHVERKRGLVGSLTCAEAWRSDDSLEELIAPSLTNRQHSEHIKKFLSIILHPKNDEWPKPLPSPEDLPDPDEIMKSFSPSSRFA